jgi:NADPH-dependent 2,4-dienoyl-CoA reductase/sulfur reductase-like enzyme
MTPRHYSIAIIGAGPYGLALTAKLAAAGMNFITFGRPMGFWQENVPLGTRLISGWITCSLADDTFDYGSYLEAMRAVAPRIFMAEQFLAYGLWFQRNTCPEPDRRMVTKLSREHGGYRLQLDDGSEMTADRVVIGTGLKPFAVRPAQFSGIDNGLVMHTSDLHDLSAFSGKRVAVIGAGQSAMDCAALLCERSAEVEIIARAAEVRWKGTDDSGILPEKPTWTLHGAIQDLRTVPQIYRRLPAFIRRRELNLVLRPAAVRSLLARLGPARFTLGTSVAGASATPHGIELRLSDGSTRTVDRVVLGTGYRVDLKALPFLSPELLKSIRTYDGYPKLSGRMESSARGLYFMGAAAASSFGRMMWLIRGARWAADTVSRALVKHCGSAEQTVSAPVPVNTES